MNDREMCSVFAKNLNSMMQRYGIKQTDIVSRLGVSKAAVSDWCAGNNIPRTDKLSKLCSLFDCNLSDLMASPNEAPDDSDAAILQAIHDKPGMRIMFDVSKKATNADIMKAVEIIKAFYRTEDGDEEK
jgi:transcriptional regulator with XRE-family HTH domain